MRKLGRCVLILCVLQVDSFQFAWELSYSLLFPWFQHRNTVKETQRVTKMALITLLSTDKRIKEDQEDLESSKDEVDENMDRSASLEEVEVDLHFQYDSENPKR